MAQQDPPVPVGQLNVNAAMVRDGVAPVLSWEIEYPSTVEEVIDIDPEDEQLTAKTRLRVQVSVVGVGLTDQYGKEYPAKSYINFSSVGWKHIFTGKGSQVDPFNHYIDRVVDEGEVIRFAAKVDENGYDYFYNESSNIRVLKNGDNPPGVSAGYTSQSSIADYLEPYIQNGKLSLGPMDLIYAAELTHTDTSHTGYDMQDAVILVRFTRVE
ncbi:hypothetical protein JIN77_07425 [Verrucomicrobiaceae bacterium R5-34]|nr:hypothetical protein [Verrucomicrobiaceae bacterium R5-34]